MESLRIIPDLEKQGLIDEEYPVIAYKDQLTIGGMGNATETGKPGVMIALKVEEGFLVAQTTLSLFLNAADILKAKYGDPR